MTRATLRYSTDSAGAGVNFGFPIGETQRINFGMTVEQTEPRALLSSEITEFIQRNGSDSLNFMQLVLIRSTLNRGVFADRGSRQSLGLASCAGQRFGIYKVTYSGERYFPLTNVFTLKLRTELGYGDSYGDTPSLPFYEHFTPAGLAPFAVSKHRLWDRAARRP